MKSKIGIAILSILLTANVTSSYAATLDNSLPNKERVIGLSEDQKKARLEEIRTRVNEIKETDKSSLSKSDRKAMKKELREMRKESKEMKGGVYLSVGAIIIIILLLIILL